MPDLLSSSTSDAPVVLIVEDDADVRGAAGLLMRRCGFSVREADAPAAALAAVAAEPIDAVLLDLNFRRGATGGEEGLACLADLRAAAPGTPVVVVTAHSGVAMAVAAMQSGAADFITKPWSNRRLSAVMEAAASRGRAERSAAPEGEAWLGESAAALQVRDLVRRAAPLDASVLAWGPAGAGKSLVARLLHAGSPRAPAPFIEVDLRAEGVGPALAALAAADMGTVALQGVEALDGAGGAALTAAVIRTRARMVAQSREAPALLRERLGGALLFHLAALEVEAPSLHRRGRDGTILARHWLGLIARRRRVAPRTLPPETEAAITGRPWPDDARGLRLMVERAALLGAGPVGPEELLGEAGPEARAASDLNLARTEKAMLQAALKRWSFNVTHAARDLGLTRAALYRRMAKHGL